MTARCPIHGYVSPEETECPECFERCQCEGCPACDDGCERAARVDELCYDCANEEALLR